MPEPLFNPNDGLTGRDGGPYLDVVEAQEAERRRAEVEGREPDFENLQPTAGVPLVTAAQIAQTLGVPNNPSQERSRAFEQAVKAASVSPDAVVAPVYSERPTDEEIEEQAAQVESDEKTNADPFSSENTPKQDENPINPTGPTQDDVNA